MYGIIDLRTYILQRRTCAHVLASSSFWKT